MAHHLSTASIFNIPFLGVVRAVVLKVFGPLWNGFLVICVRNDGFTDSFSPYGLEISSPIRTEKSTYCKVQTEAMNSYPIQ